MSIFNIGDVQRFIEQEKREENYAVPFVYGSSLVDCLRIHGIETEIKIEDTTIYASKVCAAWEKFLVATGEISGTCTKKVTRRTKNGPVEKEIEVPIAKKIIAYTGVIDSLKTRMYTWITEEYTDAYKSVATEEEKLWLETVIHFVCYRQIMIDKYETWVKTGTGFADSDVGKKIAEAYRFNYEIPEVCRILNFNIVKYVDHFLKAKEQDANLLAQDIIPREIIQQIINGVADLLRTDRLRLLPPVVPGEKLLESGEAI